MRDYRGKRKDDGEWVYGNHWCNEEVNKHYIRSMNFQPARYDYTDYEVVPESVGEDTRVKGIYGSIEIDGKMSKGGDIIEYSKSYNFAGYRNMVCFYEGGFRLFKRANDKYPIDLSICKVVEQLRGKVIGNIHDNPELLKE